MENLTKGSEPLKGSEPRQSDAGTQPLDPALIPKFTPDVTGAGTMPVSDFTGIARSIVCVMNNGSFQNYRILTLHATKGKITKIDQSHIFADFEARDMIEEANLTSLCKLMSSWKEGKALQE